MASSRYPKLTLKIHRKPDPKDYYVRCPCCSGIERRWEDSDDQLPVCRSCRWRERTRVSYFSFPGKWEVAQHLLAGLALIRAITKAVKQQKTGGHYHG